MVTALQPKLTAEESERVSWLLDLAGPFPNTIKHRITGCDFTFYNMRNFIAGNCPAFLSLGFFVPPSPLFYSMIHWEVRQMFCVAHMYITFIAEVYRPG